MHGTRSPRRCLPPTRRRRWTGWAGLCGGCEQGAKPSCTASEPMRGSGGTASSLGRRGSRSGSRVSTRSSSRTTLLREGGSRARSDCCKTSPPERSRAGSTSRGPSARSISKRGPDLPPARSMSRSRRTTSISSCGRSRSSASSRCPPETSMNRARRVPPDGGPRENRRGRHQEHGGGERLTRLDARAARELAHSRAALSDPSIRLPEASPGRVSAAALARRCRTPARCRARGPSRRGRRP